MRSAGRCKDEQQLAKDECRQDLARNKTTKTSIELDLWSATITSSSTVSDLGVLLDSQLSMADRVATLSRASLCQIRQGVVNAEESV